MNNFKSGKGQKRSNGSRRSKRFLAAIAIVLVGILGTNLPNAYSNQASAYWFEVQSIQAGELGLSGFSGLGYLPSANALYSIDEDTQDLTVFKIRGDVLSTNPIQISVSNPLNLAYNPQSFGIYTLSDQGLTEVRAGINGSVPLSQQQLYEYGLTLDSFDDPQGMAFNPNSGDLYVLDAKSSNIIKVIPLKNGGFSPESQTDVERISQLYTPLFNNLDHYFCVRK